MHVYIDTWAHYGFCGSVHKINRATDIKIVQNGKEEEAKKLRARLKNTFTNLFNDIASDFVDNVQPLGHGAVLSYPDQPYLNWKYVNGLGDIIERNNPMNYIEAVENMYRALRRYKLGDPDAYIEPMNQNDMDLIIHNINNYTNDDGEKRHKQWSQNIKDGDFFFWFC